MHITGVRRVFLCSECPIIGHSACLCTTNEKATPDEYTICHCGRLHSCILPIDLAPCEMQLGLSRRMWRKVLVTVRDCMSTFRQRVMLVIGHRPEFSKAPNEVVQGSGLLIWLFNIYYSFVHLAFLIVDIVRSLLRSRCSGCLRWSWSMELFFGLYYRDLLYAMGTLDCKYVSSLRVKGIHHTYAHWHYEIHACKAVGTHVVMHAWVKRGLQLWVLVGALVHKVSTPN